MLAALIPILGPAIGRALEKIVPDKAAELQKATEVELAKLTLSDADARRLHEGIIGQIEVNKVEAAHRSLFVAGWRPFIGWVGGCALAGVYIVQPLVQLFRGEPVAIDTSELMVLITGMLGFGGLRSFDKRAGTANDAPLGAPKPGTPVTPDMPVMGQNAAKVGRKLKLNN